MKLTMVGTGYVGLVTGVCFANTGNEVICLDVLPDKVDQINRGECPIYEPGLTELMQRNLKAGRLKATLDKDLAYEDAEMIFICVGTPSGADGKADLKYVMQAADDIAAVIKRLGPDQTPKTIVVKSTVPVGTTLAVRDRIRQTVGDIPFTVGGGISSSDDVAAMLAAGADKVAVNSAAVQRPELLNEIAGRFGNQCLVLAIDANLLDGAWRVYVQGGRTPTSLLADRWAAEAEQRGAGEILLTSMRRDGTKAGFDEELTALVALAVRLPIIASGGAGSMAHFAEIFRAGEADAGLAASIFHFGEIGIQELKAYLRNENIAVR